MFRYTMIIAFVLYVLLGWQDLQQGGLWPMLIKTFWPFTILYLIVTSVLFSYKTSLFGLLFKLRSYEILFTCALPATLYSVYVICGMAYNHYHYYWPLFILAFSLPVMIKCIQLSYIEYCKRQVEHEDDINDAVEYKVDINPELSEGGQIYQHHKRKQRIENIQHKLATRTLRKEYKAKSKELLAKIEPYIKQLEEYVNSEECNLRDVFIRNFNWLSSDHAFYKVPVPSISGSDLDICGSRKYIRLTICVINLEFTITFYADDSPARVDYNLALSVQSFVFKPVSEQEATNRSMDILDGYGYEYRKLISLLKSLEEDRLIFNQVDYTYRLGGFIKELRLRDYCYRYNPNIFNEIVKNYNLSLSDLQKRNVGGILKFNADDDDSPSVIECYALYNGSYFLLATTTVVNKNFIVDAVRQLPHLHFMFYYRQLLEILRASPENGNGDWTDNRYVSKHYSVPVTLQLNKS